jgi:hypothetical protein
MGEGFFEAIEKPVQETTGLFSNLDAYRKNVDDAKKKLSQGNKSQPTKEKRMMMTKVMTISGLVEKEITQPHKPLAT